MGPAHAAPRLTAQAVGWRGRGGEDGEWLTGRAGKDYWMHIGRLFPCQEIYSVVRKSIPLTVPFSLRCRDIIQISERTHQRSSDGRMCYLTPPPPPTSSINCDNMYSRCKLAHFCSVMSAGNYHHLVLVPRARALVGLQQIWLLPVVVADVRLVANYYALGPNQMYAAC